MTSWTFVRLHLYAIAIACGSSFHAFGYGLMYCDDGKSTLCMPVHEQGVSYPTFGITLSAIDGWVAEESRLKQQAIAAWWHLDDEGEPDAKMQIIIERANGLSLKRLGDDRAKRWGLVVSDKPLMVDGVEALELNADAKTAPNVPQQIVLVKRNGRVYSFQWSKRPQSDGPNAMRLLLAGVSWTDAESIPEHLGLSDLREKFGNGAVSLCLPKVCRADRNPQSNVETYYFAQDHVENKEALAISVAFVKNPEATDIDTMRLTFIGGMEARFSELMDKQLLIKGKKLNERQDTYTSEFVLVNPHPAQKPESARHIRYVLAVPRPGYAFLIRRP